MLFLSYLVESRSSASFVVNIQNKNSRITFFPSLRIMFFPSLKDTPDLRRAIQKFRSEHWFQENGPIFVLFFLFFFWCQSFSFCDFLACEYLPISYGRFLPFGCETKCRRSTIAKIQIISGGTEMKTKWTHSWPKRWQLAAGNILPNLLDDVVAISCCSKSLDWQFCLSRKYSKVAILETPKSYIQSFQNWPELTQSDMLETEWEHLMTTCVQLPWCDTVYRHLCKLKRCSWRIAQSDPLKDCLLEQIVERRLQTKEAKKRQSVKWNRQKHTANLITRALEWFRLRFCAGSQLFLFSGTTCFRESNAWPTWKWALIY